MKRLTVTIAASAALLSHPAWAQAPGLALDERAVLGPRLQARIGMNTTSATHDGTAAAWQQQAGVVLGDYYFSQARLGQGEVRSGFRATSGLLLGQRSLALSIPAVAHSGRLGLTLLRQPRLAMPGLEVAAEPWTAVPYLGLGWTGVSARGGWGVSADVGFARRSVGDSGGLRLSGSSGPSLDDVLRELRLTPMMQVGVSYAF